MGIHDEEMDPLPALPIKVELYTDVISYLSAKLLNELKTSPKHTLRYFAADAVKIQSHFKTALETFDSPNEVNFLNKHYRDVADLLIGKACLDTVSTFPSTGLIAVLEQFYSKPSKKFLSGACTSQASSSSRLFELNQNKNVGCSTLVRNFILEKLEGLIYVTPHAMFPINWTDAQNTFETDISTPEKKALYKASLALVKQHHFKTMTETGKMYESVSNEQAEKELYAFLRNKVMPDVFDRLEQWQIDIIENYTEQWANIIGGDAEFPANEKKRWFWQKENKPSFTKLFNFSYTYLMDVSKDANNDITYNPKKALELERQAPAMIAQILELTLMACAMLKSVYVEEAEKGDQNFDREAWVDKQKPKRAKELLV